MRLLADENLPHPLILALRALGHEVLSVRESSPGLTDEEVLSLAYESGAVLVTEDKDFGELVHRRGHAHMGIVLLRLSDLPLPSRIPLICQALDAVAHPVASFVVVRSNFMRVQQRPSALGQGS